MRGRRAQRWGPCRLRVRPGDEMIPSQVVIYVNGFRLNTIQEGYCPTTDAPTPALTKRTWLCTFASDSVAETELGKLF
ncbi:hypothetical protein GCM10023074_24850 [Microbispora amethystogenes]|uniref:Uncharacterized protein n=1 Tax=Microbispora amethystogenes TaxID=1427754 RepID=A0ABQ4F8I3_9ACTN|nr:hypothetical protein Mam01_12940 [Microbispora amethystogenes]